MGRYTYGHSSKESSAWCPTFGVAVIDDLPDQSRSQTGETCPPPLFDYRGTYHLPQARFTYTPIPVRPGLSLHPSFKYVEWECNLSQSVQVPFHCPGVVRFRPRGRSRANVDI